jgi:hypothetical protein
MKPDIINYLFSQRDPDTRMPWAALSGASEDGFILPFALKVLVPKNLSPRDESFETYQDASRNYCLRIFQKSGFLNPIEVVVLPERWLSPVEEGRFFEAILEHPHIATMKELHLLTQSFTLLVKVPPDSVRVYRGEKMDTPNTDISYVKSCKYAGMYQKNVDGFKRWSDPISVA